MGLLRHIDNISLTFARALPGDYNPSFVDQNPIRYHATSLPFSGSPQINDFRWANDGRTFLARSKVRLPQKEADLIEGVRLGHGYSREACKAIGESHTLHTPKAIEAIQTRLLWDPRFSVKVECRKALEKITGQENICYGIEGDRLACTGDPDKTALVNYLRQELFLAHNSARENSGTRLEEEYKLAQELIVTELARLGRAAKAAAPDLVRLLDAAYAPPRNVIRETLEAMGESIPEKPDPIEAPLPKPTVVAEDCKDGIDNDGDWFADVQDSQQTGYLRDEKCLALNEPQEMPHLKLASSAIVGPQGGLLALGELKVRIPPGALDKATRITLERIPGIGPDRFSYQDDYVINPAGLMFQKRVQIEFAMPPEEPGRPENLMVSVIHGEQIYMLGGGGTLKIGDRYTLVKYTDIAGRFQRGPFVPVGLLFMRGQ